MMELTVEDLAALATRWITADLADEAGIKRVDSAEGQNLVGRNAGDYAGLAIPYFVPGNGKHPREWRLRRDHPDIEYGKDGMPKEKQKYVAPPGTKNMFYFPPGVTQTQLDDPTIPILIVEGEFKAIACQRLAYYESVSPRFLPVAVSGVWNWRGKLGRENGPDGSRRDVKGPIADFARVNWNDRRVVTAFDADITMKASVAQAYRGLKRELETRRAIVGRTEWDITDGKGIDDFIFKRGPEAVIALIEKELAKDPETENSFKITDSGVFYRHWKDGRMQEMFVCERIDVICDLRDTSSEGWGRLVEWHDRDFHRHELSIPQELLQTDAGSVRARLASGGLNISCQQGARDKCIEYLQSFPVAERRLCTGHTGWQPSGAYVLPDQTIPDQIKVVFQSLTAQQHGWNKRGTWEQWRDEVSTLAVGNSRLVFVISVAFASALLELASLEGGGFHLVGPSSAGKTTALKISGSVCGGGSGAGGFVKSWRSTANGLEAVCVAHNDALLPLDELAQLDAREASEIAYLIANGFGKNRMSKGLSLRDPLTWRLLFLSAGEMSLRDHAASANKRIRAGSEVRITHITADAGQGFGLFDQINGGAKDAEAFARLIVSRSMRFYGTAFREFVRRVALDREAVAGRAKAAVQSFIDDYAKGAYSEISRVAGRFGLVTFAGTLATEYGICKWAPTEAAAATERLFGEWLSERGTKQSSDHAAAIAQVRLFLEANGSSRFQWLDFMEEDPNFKTASAIQNRAGFRRKAPGSEEIQFLIFPEVFRKQVCEGINYRIALTALEGIGALDREKPAMMHQARVPELGKTWFYCISSKVIERGGDD